MVANEMLSRMPHVQNALLILTSETKSPHGKKTGANQSKFEFGLDIFYS